MGGLSIG
jgi:elongator complex protein 2